MESIRTTTTTTTTTKKNKEDDDTAARVLPAGIARKHRKSTVGGCVDTYSWIIRRRMETLALRACASLIAVPQRRISEFGNAGTAIDREKDERLRTPNLRATRATQQGHGMPSE